MTAIFVYNDDGTGKTRIFSCPEEYRTFRAELNDMYRKICDAALYTGCRPVELRRLNKHPDWFDKTRRVVNLPKGSILKTKAKPWRSVLLTLDGAIAVEKYLAVEFDSRFIAKNGKKIELIGPTDSAWHQALTLAAEKSGIDGGSEGVCPKMFRKTCLSWRISAHENLIGTISKSMGHDLNTMIKYYLGIGFTKAEKESIAKWDAGWGEGA